MGDEGKRGIPPKASEWTRTRRIPDPRRECTPFGHCWFANVRGPLAVWPAKLSAVAFLSIFWCFTCRPSTAYVFLTKCFSRHTRGTRSSECMYDASQRQETVGHRTMFCAVNLLNILQTGGAKGKKGRVGRVCIPKKIAQKSREHGLLGHYPLAMRASTLHLCHLEWKTKTPLDSCCWGWD